MGAASSSVAALVAPATGASFTGLMVRPMLSLSLSWPSLVRTLRVSGPL